MRPAWPLPLLAALTACAAAPHVALTAPARSAPLEARLEAYKRLRPRGSIERATVDSRSGAVHDRETSAVLLNNGTWVYHLEDLLPLVEPDSATAAAIAKSERLRRRSPPLRWGGAAGVLFGSLALFGFTNGVIPGGGSTATAASVGLIAGGAIAQLLGRSHRFRRHDAQLDALNSLDESLREKLGLCEHLGALVDCDHPIAPATAPASAPTPGLEASRRP